jgi:AraC-like DNA-binding protein
MYCRADAVELFRIKFELEAILSRLYLISVKGNGDRRSTVFTSATAFMQEHLGESISLSSLALALGVSVSTLKSVFRRECGCGVNSYYIDLKLAQASKWLCESEMSISEIADKLGYSSQFYFSEQFKARYGASPQSFRREQGKNWVRLL